MQSYTPVPNLHSQPPPSLQTRPLYPNPSLPVQSSQAASVPTLPLNRQDAFPFPSSLTPRPYSSIDPHLRIQESLPVNQSQIVGSQTLRTSGKYGNKYSFKRNSTTRSKALSFANRANPETMAVLAQQEDILGRIRVLASSRRGSIETAADTVEGVTLWNTLTEIYNLTLAGNSSQLSPLAQISLRNRVQAPSQPPRQAFSKVGVRPVEVLQSSQPVKFSRQAQEPIRPSSQRVQGEFVPVDLPSYSAVNNNELYNLEIRELRTKIEVLEQEKSALNDRIRTLQQNNVFSGQETVQLYRAEINSLRQQISQISESYGNSYPNPQQEGEIAELRQGIQQLSEAVRQYEEQLLRAQNHISFLEQSRNEEGATFQTEVQALQRAMNDHTTQLKLREEREATLLRQFEEQQTKRHDCLAQLSSAREEIRNLQEQREGKFDEMNLRNKSYSSDLKEEVTKLNLELNQAQQRYAESNEHLVKAEDYIVELQKAREILFSQFDNELRGLQQENSRLSVELNTVKDDLNTARAEAEILTARAATSVAEYEDMECRYRQTVESLSTRYDQLLDERNSLTSKLNAVQPGPHSAAVGNEEADALRHSLQQLTAQVSESQEHLRTAEAYIEENLLNWEQAAVLKQQHDQQQVFVAAIHADLESTRRQNIELGQRIQDFERMVAETERLREENEQLTIIIREKDNAPVATSLKQIDEVQAALDNYVILYRESEGREKQLQAEGLELRRENERVRGELAKIGQLEQYLARAENFIIEQEGKMNQTISSFEAENSQLKEHLFKAEEYILALQEAAEKQSVKYK